MSDQTVTLLILCCLLPENEIGRTGGWSRSAYFFGGKFHRTLLAGQCSVAIVGCWLALD